jgi:hypothetical protein
MGLYTSEKTAFIYCRFILADRGRLCAHALSLVTLIFGQVLCQGREAEITVRRLVSQTSVMSTQLKPKECCASG